MNLHSVFALSTAALVGVVFVGLCLLGLVVCVGLFVYAAKRDGTLEPHSAANERWTPDDEGEE